ncbi:hypothetical protein GY45DRAFT_353663 [Cubamyces sp. BRFM 1775]|nr:hypothetical protein GY45DRAFT_353663 [Cubamyces sp. BRFM 1775]
MSTLAMDHGDHLTHLTGKIVVILMKKIIIIKELVKEHINDECVYPMYVYGPDSRLPTLATRSSDRALVRRRHSKTCPRTESLRMQRDPNVKEFEPNRSCICICICICVCMYGRTYLSLVYMRVGTVSTDMTGGRATEKVEEKEKREEEYGRNQRETEKSRRREARLVYISKPDARYKGGGGGDGEGGRGGWDPGDNRKDTRGNGNQGVRRSVVQMQRNQSCSLGEILGERGGWGWMRMQGREGCVGG